MTKNVNKCNPPDFKLYLGKLNNNIFPILILCNSNLEYVFTALSKKKKKKKKDIVPYGEKCIS